MWRSRWRIASEPTIYIASELLSVIYLLTLQIPKVVQER